MDKWAWIIGAMILALIFALGYTYYLLLTAQGMRITSWWRTPWHNAAVGGVSASLHQLGLAWDVIPVTEENEIRLRSYGLRVINEGDHLHAQIV